MKGYTDYHPWMRAELKDPAMTGPDAVLAWYRAKMLECKAAGDAAETKKWSVMYSHLHLETMLLKGMCTHLFLPGREFCDWLVQAVPKKITHKFLHTVTGFMPYDQAQSDEALRVVCLHFPTGSGRNSVLVGVVRPPTGALAAAYPAQAAAQQVSISVCSSYKDMDALGGEYAYMRLRKDEEADTAAVNDRVNWYINLVIGLGLYLDCAPEFLHPGVPAGLKLKEPLACGSMTITEDVRMTHRDEGGTVSPHYRSGHFRLLSAERYVNKRGQTVFVRPCFVHGTAATVQDEEHMPQVIPV